MEARTLGPCLPTIKRPSAAATDESEFYPSYLPSTSTLQQPRPAEQIVGRAPKKQASEPLAETHWGKEKQRMGGTSTSKACKHTRKKQALPREQATNNVPAEHQTRSPRDAPQSPTLPSKPNQPEPKKRTPAINDPTAGSPTVTLLRLLLPLNDKVQ